MPEGSTSVLPRILARAGALPAVRAEHDLSIQPGRIYVAPPGFHLTLARDRMQVTRGAREHGHIPAIDPLFRSAALAYGQRAVGVVLSGLLDDGTVGLIKIKRARGIAVVQDPEDTAFPSMPRSAIANAEVDYILAADAIGPLLVELAGHAHPVSAMRNPHPRVVRQEVEQLTTHQDERSKMGEPSPYGCPECGGVLWELNDDERLEARVREIEQQAQHIRDLLLSGVGAREPVTATER
jgi:two-component system chemotaxis response regulator CheB